MSFIEFGKARAGSGADKAADNYGAGLDNPDLAVVLRNMPIER